MAVARGTEQLGVGIDKELAAAFRAFVKARGETIREAVELALRRHMANPPPKPELPPLPPVPTIAPSSAAAIAQADAEQRNEQAGLGKLEARADAARAEDEQKAKLKKGKPKK